MAVRNEEKMTGRRGEKGEEKIRTERRHAGQDAPTSADCYSRPSHGYHPLNGEIEVGRYSDREREREREIPAWRFALLKRATGQG